MLAALLLATDVTVHSDGELRAALLAARPGDVISIAPGVYSGGLTGALRGTAERPIVLRAADAAHAPIVRGGAVGLHLSDAAHVELADLVFEGQTGNGVNIDDGGSSDTPARGIALRRLVVRDVGPQGNCDGIKLSGVVDFSIDGCTIERWGSGAGSGIDLVGCANGAIERCTLRNPTTRATASGVQAKGGSRAIRIERNRFEHAGERAVNAGGSTGLDYFRPPLAEGDAERSEAADLSIAGNTFVGSDAPIACVGVDGASVRFNTLYHPERWALRILQETRDPRFVACRDVEFTDNLVVFRSTHWSAGGVNVGPGTQPESFRFTRNLWVCGDAATRTRELVQRPGNVRDDRYGVDPLFVDAAELDLRVREGSPAADVGAHAFTGQPPSDRGRRAR